MIPVYRSLAGIEALVLSFEPRAGRVFGSLNQVLTLRPCYGPLFPAPSAARASRARNKGTVTWAQLTHAARAAAKQLNFRHLWWPRAKGSGQTQNKVFGIAPRQLTRCLRTLRELLLPGVAAHSMIN